MCHKKVVLVVNNFLIYWCCDLNTDICIILLCLLLAFETINICRKPRHDMSVIIEILMTWHLRMIIKQWHLVISDRCWHVESLQNYSCESSPSSHCSTFISSHCWSLYSNSCLSHWLVSVRMLRQSWKMSLNLLYLDFNHLT